MRIAETQVYKFEELSPKAKERAIEKARQHLNETWDGDMLKESFKSLLEERGLPEEDIQFSLGHSQGDGVGFYGKVDINKYAAIHGLEIPETIDEDGRYLEFSDAFSFEISGSNGHYHHECSGHVAIQRHDWSDDIPEGWEQIAGELRSHIQEMYYTTSRQLAREGYEELDYENSDEYITEFIQANEYEYEENGEMF